jgi:hypothetical protein
MKIDAKTTMLLQNGTSISSLGGQKIRFKTEQEAEEWLSKKLFCPWCGKEITRKDADSIVFKNVLNRRVFNEYHSHIRTTTAVEEYNLKRVFRCSDCTENDEKFHVKIKTAYIIGLLVVVLFFFGAYLYTRSWGLAAGFSFLFLIIFYGIFTLVLDRIKYNHEHRVTYDHILECGAEDERDLVVL